MAVKKFDQINVDDFFYRNGNTYNKDSESLAWNMTLEESSRFTPTTYVFDSKPTEATRISVYVSGKYSDDSDDGIANNIEEARNAGIELLKTNMFAPVVPHCLCSWWDRYEPKLTYEQFMAMDLILVEQCDAMLVLPNWINSSGTKIEKEHAIKLGKPIFHSFEDLVNWGQMMLEGII